MGQQPPLRFSLTKGEFMLKTTLNALVAVVIVIGIAAIGFLFGKLGYINKSNKKLLIRLIISAGMPALVVKNAFGGLNLSELEKPHLLFLLPILSMAATVAIAFLLAKILKPSAVRRGGFIAMCAFSNSVFVGLPMNTGLFGEEAVPYVMCYYIVNTTLFWTIGNYLIGKSGEAAGAMTTHGGILPEEAGVSAKKSFQSVAAALKKIASPPLIALAISLPCLALGIRLPEPAVRLAGYVGNLVTPLALFYIGFALYDYGFKSLKPDKLQLCVMLMRFAIAPLSMALLCKLFGLHGMPSGVLIIESAMPVMTQAVVVAADHDADEAFVAGGMGLTTLGCFVVVPLLMLLMQVLGIYG